MTFFSKGFPSIWLLIIVMIFSLLSLLNVFRPQTLLLWKVSILTKEFGNWFFLLLLPMGIWSFLQLVDGLKASMQVSLPILICFLLWIVCSWLFLRPAMQAAEMAESVASNLQTEFPLGGSDRPVATNLPIDDRDATHAPVFSYLKLWGFGGSRNTTTATMNGPLMCSGFSRVQVPGTELHLDMYTPQLVGAGTSAVDSAKAARAWIMVVHGGGWDSGDSTQLSALNFHLCTLGYSVVAVSYGLAPKHQWPRQQLDLKAQFQYLQENASKLGLDMDRWAILGRSAGGQLAGNFAYSQKPNGLRAAFLFYPATDLIFGYEAGDEDDILESRQLLRNFMGSSPYESEAKYRSASVLDFLSADVVPTVLFHGVPDTLTWFKHSERLYNRLRELKVKSLFVRYPWAAHGFDFRLSGPAGQISTAVMEDVLQSVFADAKP